MLVKVMTGRVMKTPAKNGPNTRLPPSCKHEKKPKLKYYVRLSHFAISLQYSMSSLRMGDGEGGCECHEKQRVQ